LIRRDFCTVCGASRPRRRAVRVPGVPPPKRRACAHPQHGSWLADEDIGALPREWNWLTTEYPDNDDAKLLHYTLGTPCFKDYQTAEMAEVWHAQHARTQQGMNS
jgi:hypothetical protein